jgi:cellulose synthase operon protein C
MAGLVETYLQAGDVAAAGAYIAAVLADDPDNLDARLIAARLLALGARPRPPRPPTGRSSTRRRPRPRPTAGLHALLAGAGAAEAAEAALDAGIAASDGDATLLFLKAGLLEEREDFEGAIALYETLYARDSGSLLIANNLASLLATHRDDAESLERAHAIARRLRDSRRAAVPGHLRLDPGAPGRA